MKFRIALIAMASALALSACVTQEGYRQRMSLLQGAPADSILLDWGPPQSRTPMSDGRELWAYSKTTVDEQAGYWRDETREVRRTYKDKDGVERSETITETFPVWQPPQVLRASCSTRFVMSAGRVETVAFDGEGCVAEELQ